ncbi:hypothetical protein T09_10650 [Trichinella sp. T9]|nr:hypothetical protein T09_10650 [Trichinella sp. T9]
MKNRLQQPFSVMNSENVPQTLPLATAALETGFCALELLDEEDKF